MRQRPLTPTLFPYTTLFRSRIPHLIREDNLPRSIVQHEPAEEHSRVEPQPGVRECSSAGSCWTMDRGRDRKSTRLNSSHLGISYAVFCLKKKRYTIYHAQRQ